MLNLILLMTSAIANEQQPWEKTTVAGFGIEDGKLDYTEGFGAYMDLPLKPGTRNLDNGGGDPTITIRYFSKKITA